MQVAIVFTTYGSSSALGNFGPGDEARCSAQHARHLVDEVKCARYALAETKVQASAPSTSAARKPRARKEA